MKIFFCFLFGLLLNFFTSDVEAILATCDDDNGCTNVANAITCSTTCQCNVNYDDVSNVCELTTCTDGSSDPAAVCGTNTACTKDTSKCSCVANYVEDTNVACAKIDCATDVHATCTNADANSYCTGSECACKKNFVGTNLADCERMSCSQNSDCTEASSYCATAGCSCVATLTGDATTGACTTRIECAQSATSATIESTCGGANTVCELDANTYKCFCKAGYSTTATGLCAQTECTTGNVGTNCGADYACSSGGKCECASTFQASGAGCKKTCTSSSDCNTNAACVNGICECNVNYQGNGATCTQIECSGTVTTNCHPNSQCSSDNCACASGYVADGALCKKSCTADSGCATNALCVSSKCECKATYVGDGANTCTPVACAANTDCTLENSSCNMTSSACVCADGYQFGTTTIECVKSGASAVVFNFTFMAVSFLMAAFLNKM